MRAASRGSRPATGRSTLWRLVLAAASLAATLGAAVLPAAVAAAGERPLGSSPQASGLRVVSVTPRPASSAANGAAPVVVRLSGDLSASSPRPAIEPRIAGSWAVTGASFVFTPAGAFAPGTRVRLSIPGGASGVLDAAGHRLSRSRRFAFTVAPINVLRAEQILAELDYLPVRFHPAAPGQLRGYALAKAAYDPPAGSFVWSWDAPAPLRAEWVPGRAGVVLSGAVMAFQAKLGLPASGALDAATTAALLQAARDPGPAVQHMGYRYALVVESSPETFTLYQNGRAVIESPTNTGIAVTPTAIGTFPVYLRLATQVMTGTEPNGTHYADPVAWVAYFYGGDAVHYIARSAYGYPQSLGCVELPWAPAAQAWPLLGIGTLVTVEP